MGRSALGTHKPKRYKARNGETRWRAFVPIGYYEDGSVKRKTVTGYTYRECADKLADLQRDIQSNGAPIDRSMTLGRYKRVFLETKERTRTPKTMEMYHTVCDIHLAPYDMMRLTDIHASDITRMMANAKAHDRAGRETGPVGSSMRRHIRSTMHSLLDMAVHDGIIPHNPAERIEIPESRDVALREAAHERHAFSVPEMRSMLKAADDSKDHAFAARMWFRLLTGMRQGEILGATLEDLHIGRKRLTTDDGTKINAIVGEYAVNWKLEQLHQAHGCGKPDHGVYPCGHSAAYRCPQRHARTPDGFDSRQVVDNWYLTRPKSNTGRIVPLVPALAERLRLYIKETAKQTNPAGLLFHHEDGTPIIAKEDNEDFRRLMALAKVSDIASHHGHETRHSIVSLLAAMGVDMQLIQQIVGHSSITMVEHYRHADAAEKLRAMDTIDKALGLKQLSA